MVITSAMCFRYPGLVTLIVWSACCLPGWTAEIEFVRIPPGEFRMGCQQDGECAHGETPAHVVRITRQIEAGKFEVTQSQWQAIMGGNPSNFSGPDLPVEQVSWNDVQEFLLRLNGRNDGYRYRLPTEAEWEYAARAGTTAESYGKLDGIAWYGLNSGDKTHPVGGKQPNAWGLHDMIGNVWEWCQDWYSNSYYAQFEKQPAVDPAGPSTGEYRVMRGGSWYKFLWFLRVSSRFRERPGESQRHVGFRCVREKR